MNTMQDRIMDALRAALRKRDLDPVEHWAFANVVRVYAQHKNAKGFRKVEPILAQFNDNYFSMIVGENSSKTLGPREGYLVAYSDGPKIELVIEGCAKVVDV